MRSLNCTLLHTALFEHSLLDDVRFDDDVEQLCGCLLAHAHAQAVAFQALAQQPTGAQAGALAPPMPPDVLVPRHQ